MLKCLGKLTSAVFFILTALYAYDYSISILLCQFIRSCSSLGYFKVNVDLV